MTTTRVYVYLVEEATGGTLGFSAFGSLVQERLVALHPVPAEKVFRDRSPAVPADDLVPRPILGRPLRCLVVDAVGLEVIDGHGLSDTEDPQGAPTGVRLDAPSACAPDPVPLPAGVVLTDEMVLEALASYLADASLDDPDVPPHPAPRRPPVPPLLDDDPPGKRPWWCSIWPGAAGCGAPPTVGQPG